MERCKQPRYGEAYCIAPHASKEEALRSRFAVFMYKQFSCQSYFGREIVFKGEAIYMPIEK